MKDHNKKEITSYSNGRLHLQDIFQYEILKLKTTWRITVILSINHLKLLHEIPGSFLS